MNRQEFDSARAAAAGVERREGRILAAVAVGLGAAQFLFLKWAEGPLPHRTAVAIAGPCFLAYCALVGVLIWRMKRRTAALRPQCPQCGAMLEGMSERVAAATGNCDRCGGKVID